MNYSHKPAHLKFSFIWTIGEFMQLFDEDWAKQTDQMCHKKGLLSDEVSRGIPISS